MNAVSARQREPEDRASVTIVAHGIHDAGGMERILAEQIRRMHRKRRIVVIASDVAADLQPLVDWRPLRVPRRPFPLKFVLAMGETHSVGEFVREAFQSVGIDVWNRFVVQDESLIRSGDASELRGNPAKAAQVLGWPPTRSFRGVACQVVQADLAENMTIPIQS